MKLLRLTSALDKPLIIGRKDLKITSITDDSRKVERGSLFIAIKGLTFDGHDFIKQVIDRGVIAVVGERVPEKEVLSKICFVKVGSSRQALGILASRWYGDPSSKLQVIGVTGTDGKTTTVNLIAWILKAAGLKVGMVSTINALIGGKTVDTGFHVTNPEPLPLHKLLSEMVQNKCEYAVLEVTSHGLDQERVAGIKFDIGVLTNITHEHLDYHKTFANYLKVKVKLFQNVKVAVLNRDDKSFTKVRRLIPGVKVIDYSLTRLSGELGKIVKKRFPEKYNQSNALAAISVAETLGVSKEQILLSVKRFPGVEGRMQEVKNSLDLKILIDFAHTPNGLENVLSYLKSSKTRGSNLICITGAEGKRDKTKRPMMGKIAIKYSDSVILTAVDPRDETVEEINKQMIGVLPKKNIFSIPGRGEAVSFAINKLARKGDVIVICGKGHEKSMCYGQTEYPWSDFKAVEHALRGKFLHLRGGRRNSSNGEDHER